MKDETSKNEIMEIKPKKNEIVKNDMQKNDLTCEIVQDLLPSYMDKLTSDVTNEASKDTSTAVRHARRRCGRCRRRNTS